MKTLESLKGKAVKNSNAVKGGAVKGGKDPLAHRTKKEDRQCVRDYCLKG